MSDERQDDEILGRALSRAIETIELNETPYEESRMLTVRARRRFGTLQFAGLVAAIGAAVAIGTWLNAAREGTEAGPVAASPPSSTPAATQPTFVTAMPRQTATPTVVVFSAPENFTTSAGFPSLGRRTSGEKSRLGTRGGEPLFQLTEEDRAVAQHHARRTTFGTTRSRAASLSRSRQISRRSTSSSRSRS